MHMHIHTKNKTSATSTPTTIRTVVKVEKWSCCFAVEDPLLLVISVVSFVLFVVSFESVLRVSVVIIAGVKHSETNSSEK